MMPLHRRGESGLGESVQLRAQSPCWLSCAAPQVHCRSEPVSYYGANLAPLVDVESWFPATSGFELAARNATSPELRNFQQPAEMSMPGNVGDGVESNAVSFPLSDYQSETWWPPINVQINLQTAMIHQNILNVDRKPSSSDNILMPNFTSGLYNSIESLVPPRLEPAPPRLEPWFPSASRDSVAATVDLPQLDIIDTRTVRESPAPASALAAVSTAVAEATAAVAVAVAPVLTTPSPAPAPPAPAPAPAPAGPSRVARVTKAASRKRKSVSAPTSPSGAKAATTTPAVQKSKGASIGKRPSTQRQNHIWSERQRRKGMNYLFETLRSFLPHPAPTNKTDKSTVVGEIIKYIQSLQVQLELLTKKQQQMLAARTLVNTNPSNASSPFQTLPRAFVSNGLTLVDHSSDPSSLTAITALPPLGRESCLQSHLGANVGLHVCGLNVFITTSSPRGRRGLFYELLLTIHKHALDVINATISTSSSSTFHSLHCQASQDSEPLNNDLHHALQGVINQFV